MLSAARILAVAALAALLGGAGPAPYLAPGAVPDGVRILPPPPAPGSAQAQADRRIFAETRALQGGPRWSLAASDVDTEAFEHYACALGVQLTPQSAPALVRVLARASAGALVGPVKEHYAVKRPYLGSDAPICQAKTEHLAANGDYPSGHAAGGWMEALILAELAPDRATQILARGRAFGESRAVCGSHSASAVQAGWMAGSAVAAVLHGQAEFRADMDAARIELARLRKTAPPPPAAGCRLEDEALATSPY